MKRFAITLGVAATAAFFVLGVRAFAQGGELRTIPLVVMSPEGKLVNGLTAENVRVKGAGANVQSVELDTGPRHIVLLLDISASMEDPADSRDGSKWTYAKKMAKMFLNYVSGSDQSALYVFAEKSAELVAFTHDRAAIRSAIDALPEPGSKAAHRAYGAATTHAEEALHVAVLSADKELGFGDAVIFFSDGEFQENGQPHLLDSLTEDLERRGARVFLAFAFGSQPSWRHEEDVSLWLSQISSASNFVENTGGFSFGPARFIQSGWLFSVYPCDSPEERMKALYDAVQGTYQVRLQSDWPLRKRETFRLETVDSRGKPQPRFLLLYPREIYPD